jgi:2'-5' RNA ligase
MARPRDNLRLFVGVYPPPEVAGRMLAALGDLQLPPYRLTPVGQLHMTLQFIGDTPVKDLDATVESVDRSRAGLPPFELKPLRLMALPKRGPARLVPGDRFLPHLTLCRFRAPTRVGPLDEPLALPAYPVTELKLMRSTLHPDGARHHEVAVFSLEGPDG